MALKLGNFDGWESGDIEGRAGFGGPPTVVSTNPRSGNFNLNLTTSQSQTMYASQPTKVDDNWIFGIAIFPTTKPSTKGRLITFQRSNRQFSVVWDTNGDLILSDSNDTELETESDPLTMDAWNFIEIYLQNDASGNAVVHLNGSEIMSQSGQDFSNGTGLDQITISTPLGAALRADDYYCYSGATGASDMLGVGAKVSKGYNNTAEDATDQGSTLDNGTWADASEIPANDGTDAEYDTSNASGFTRTDEGSNSGPGGDLVSSDVIKGAIYNTRLKRAGGGGSNHFFVYGVFDGVSTDTTQTFAIEPSTSFIWPDSSLYPRLEEGNAFVPDYDEYFDLGMEWNSGGQDMHISLHYACVLYVELTSTPASDSQSAFLDSEVNDLDSQSSYLKGQDTDIDSQPAYLTGNISSTDSQPAFLAGGIIFSSSKPSFLEGAAGSVGSQPAYLKGLDTDLDSQSAYLDGGIGVTSSKPAFLKGIDTDLDSQPAYLAGGLLVNDSQPAYLNGFVSVYENFDTYTEVDPNSRLAVTTNKATGVSVGRDEEVFLYKDKGNEHYDEVNLEFEIQQLGSSTNSGRGGIGLSASAIGDVNNFDNNDVVVFAQRETGTIRRIRLVRGNHQGTSNSSIINHGQNYYCTLTRPAGGDTFTLKIYTDSNRTSLFDTRTLSGYGTTIKYRYMYGFVNFDDGVGSGGNKWFGHTERLKDLIPGTTDWDNQPAYMNGVDTDLDSQQAYMTGSGADYEDFLTFTEVDALNRLIVTKPQVTGTQLDANVTGYLYKDKGVDNYDLIDIQFEGNQTTSDQSAIAGPGLTSSVLDDVSGWATTDIWVALRRLSSGTQFRVDLVRGNHVASDVWNGGDFNTVYYYKLERAAGSDTVTLKIYSDFERTNLLATLSVSGYGTGTKYRYLYGISNNNFESGGKDWAGNIRNMSDLSNLGTEVSDSQSAFTKGIDTDLDSQPAYLIGSIDTLDSQTAYTSGVVRSSQSAFIYGHALRQGAYLSGTLTEIQSFYGFESGSPTTSGGNGTVVTTNPRSGTFCYETDGTGKQLVVQPYHLYGVPSAGQIVGFGVYYDTLNDNHNMLIVKNYLNDQQIRVLVTSSGDVTLYDFEDTLLKTETGIFVTGQWYYVEIFWQNTNDGSFIMYVDGVEKLAYYGGDFLDEPQFVSKMEFTAEGTTKIRWDDIYTMGNVGGPENFLGKDVHISKGYHNTIEDATDQGDELDFGNWRQTSDFPFTDLATQFYGVDGKEGWTRTDEGTKVGPKGDLTSIDIPIAAKWNTRAKIDGSPSGAFTEDVIYGKYDGFSTDTVFHNVDFGLDSSFFWWYDAYQITEDPTFIPKYDEYFVFGFGLITGTGANLAVSSQYAVLLYVTAQGSTDSKSAYLKGRDSTLDSQPAFLEGGGTLTSDAQIAYLAGGLVVLDATSGYLKGQDTDLDSQPAYLKGQNDTSNLENTIPAFLVGQDTLTDAQPAYLLGNINISNSVSGYLKGVDTDLTSQEAYLAGQDTGLDSQPAYLEGVAPITTSQPAYLHGEIHIVDSTPAYLKGLDTDLDNQSAFLIGGIISIDSQPSYLKGIDTDLDSQPAFLVGGLIVLDSQPAYLTGIDTDLDSQPAYLKGLDTDLDSIPAYMDAELGSIDTQPAFLSGIATDLDSQPAYLAGSINTLDTQPVYLLGDADDLDSQQAYLTGGLIVTDSQPAYTTGIAGAQVGQPAYTKGLDTTLDSNPAYLFGGLNINSSISAYLDGSPGASSIKAYLEGLTYFPFTEDFTGSDEDPWPIAKWVSEEQ